MRRYIIKQGGAGDKRDETEGAGDKRDGMALAYGSEEIHFLAVRRRR